VKNGSAKALALAKAPKAEALDSMLPLDSLLSGLRLLRGEQDMRELTPKEVMDLGRKWGKHYLSGLSPKYEICF